MSKFNAGDKVCLPTTKSTGSHIDDSHVMMKARKSGQDFLYVTCTENYCDGRGHQVYACDHIKESVTGDYFSETDLKPYIDKLPADMFYKAIGLSE